MKNTRFQRLLAPGLLGLAVVFLVAGGMTSYEISPDQIEIAPSVPVIEPIPVQTPWTQPQIPEPPPSDPAKVIPTSISDLDLVVNATFTGIEKIDGMLYWTYDPTEKRGKRACPT